MRSFIPIVFAYLVQTSNAEDKFDTSPEFAASVRFEVELKNLEESYKKKLTDLRVKYGRELSQIRRAALERGDLEGAQRILAIQEELQSKVKAHEPGGTVVHFAKWGASSKWIDVTEETRVELARRGARKTAAEMEFPDPAFGRRKALVIVFTRDGDLGIATIGTDQTVELPRP